MLGVLAPLSACGEIVIRDRFQPEHIVELLAHYRVTFFGGGAPAIYAGVLAARNLRGADLSALRVCPAGGAPFAVELMERWRRATGLEIYEGYGMSEMASISAATPASGVWPGSVGKPVPGADVQVVDLHTGLRMLPAGQTGELRVRGSHMMTGYCNQPEESSQTIRDGFIYTGDIGYFDDDGFLFIIDRKKDVVFVKALISSHARSRRRSTLTRASGWSASSVRRTPAVAASAWSLSLCPEPAIRSRRPRPSRTARRGSPATSARLKCGWSGNCL
jgi:long-chain acyl-CoA synthetase